MIYLGIDVSKAKLHACLLNAEGQSKTKGVDNSPPGIALLLRGRPGKGPPPLGCTP